MNCWIFTTPRSRSNFIAGEIRRRLGGHPLSSEFFNPDNLRRNGFVPDPDAPVGSYPDFLPAVEGSGIVFLRRRDVIRQGISLFIAQRTGSWKSSKQPTTIAPLDVEYDHDEIENAVSRIELFNSLLQRFLLVHRLDHLTVWYEDFKADPDGESARILAHLHLPPFDGPLSDRQPFAVQATHRNDEFYARFLEDERRRHSGDGSYRGPWLCPGTTPDSGSDAGEGAGDDAGNGRGTARRETAR
jgi:hypothetical protein